MVPKACRAVSPWYTDKADHPHWHTFGEFLDTLENTDLGVNAMAFVGHGTIHRAVLGTALRAGEPDEVAQMARMVDQAMDEGAGGFSSGLEYFPRIMAAPQHLAPMCEIATKHDRLCATHVRNRDTHYDLGFAEAIATARQAGAKLQISHIQPRFGAPDYAMNHTLETIELARRHDVDIDLCLQQPECAVISDTIAIANDGILKDISARSRAMAGRRGSCSTMSATAPS